MTNEDKALVERLRATMRKEFQAPQSSVGKPINYAGTATKLLSIEALINPNGPKAADRIEALSAENEVMYAALHRLMDFSPAYMWRAADIKSIARAALGEQQC